MRQLAELEGLIEKYSATHSAQNLGGVRGAEIGSCELERKSPDEQYHIAVGVFSIKRLSPRQREKVEGHLLKNTPVEYQGEHYDVKVNHYTFLFPRWWEYLSPKHLGRWTP